MDIIKEERKLLKKINNSGTPAVIPITLDNISELTYKHDPHAKDEMRLNLVIEDYLMEEVLQAPTGSPVVLELRFSQINDGDRELAEKIIRNNFARYLKVQLAAKKKEMKRWRFNLAFGIVFLAGCFTLGQFARIFPSAEMNRIFTESLSILGWVALWDPASYFLYGWREGTENITAALRLKNANTVVHT